MIESVGRIEPCGIEENLPEALVDLVRRIREAASLVGTDLHPDTRAALAQAVRIANAQYSNAIEGIFARPEDIEDALLSEQDRQHAELGALAGAAHVRAQQWLDQGLEAGLHGEPTSVAFILETHRRLYAEMPDDLRQVDGAEGAVEILPGAYRMCEVTIGRHLPPSAGRIPDFMTYFERRYRGLTRGDRGKILTIPAAHHRLSYIHPFADGNGRVGRLMTHAMVQVAGIGADGLWSISRALANGLRDPGEYKARMAGADQPRRGDRDGRGNLSLSVLESFTRWFLDLLLDELRFARIMFDGDGLQARYRNLVRAELPGNDLAVTLVDTIFRDGSIDRSRIASTGLSDAPLSSLVSGGVLTDQGGRIALAAPARHWDHLLPRL